MMKLLGIAGIKKQDIIVKVFAGLALFPSTLVAGVAALSLGAVDSLSPNEQFHTFLSLGCRIVGIVTLWWLIGNYHTRLHRRLPLLFWLANTLGWIGFIALATPLTTPVLLVHGFGNILLLYGYMPVFLSFGLILYYFSCVIEKEK